MGATDARERVIADSQFGGGATAFAPGTWYIGLSTTTPAADGSGFTEPSGGAYARVPIANNTTNWSAATTADGVTRKVNAVKATFPNPTAPWGACVAWGLFVAQSGGTPEYTNPLGVVISPRAGNTPVEFDVGQIVLRWA